ncbi:MAG: hypothetical protein ACHQX3_00520 [Nitrospirales bacterium]
MEAEKPVVRLIGANGNVFNLIALCKISARQAGWTAEKTSAVVNQMLSSHSYDDVLVVIMEHFDVQ